MFLFLLVVVTAVVHEAVGAKVILPLLLPARLPNGFGATCKFSFFWFGVAAVFIFVVSCFLFFVQQQRPQ